MNDDMNILMYHSSHVYLISEDSQLTWEAWWRYGCFQCPDDFKEVTDTDEEEDDTEGVDPGSWHSFSSEEVTDPVSVTLWGQDADMSSFYSHNTQPQ